MIGLIIDADVPIALDEEFQTNMREDVALSLNEEFEGNKACIRFDILLNKETQDDRVRKYTIYQIFISEQALDAHRKTPYFQKTCIDFQAKGGFSRLDIRSFEPISGSVCLSG